MCYAYSALILRVILTLCVIPIICLYFQLILCVVWGVRVILTLCVIPILCVYFQLILCVVWGVAMHLPFCLRMGCCVERWGAGVETQKNVRGEIGGWGRVPFNETYAPSFSTIYDGA